MIAIIILGAFSFTACLARVFFVKKASAKMGFLAKTMCSCLFFVAALIAAVTRGAMDLWAIFMIAAFALALLGDVILVLPYYSKEEFKDFFSLVGGAAFLFGHVFYLLVFLNMRPINWQIIPIVLIVPAVFLVLIKTKLLNVGNKYPFILVYGLILGILLFSAISMAMNGGKAGYVAVFAAIFFILSDTLLFLFNYGRADVRSLRIVSKSFLPLYYLAQFLFTVVFCLLPQAF